MTSDTNWIFCSVPKDVIYTGTDEEAGDQHEGSPEREKSDAGDEDQVRVQVSETWEEVLDQSLKDLGIRDVVSISSKDGSRVQVYFPVDQELNDTVLHYLNTRGFGTCPGTSLGFMPFAMFFKEEEEEAGLDFDDDSVFEGQELKQINSMSNKIFSKLSSKLSGFKKAQDEFLKSVTSRLTVAQVVSGVKNSSKVTFDFVMYTFFAGCIASCGIMNNAVTDIAAAMCIEPVMATVLVGAFGTVIHDWSLIKMGLRNNSIVITECILTGFLYGLIAMFWSDSWQPPGGHWPTSEMVNRATYRSLVMGALQASAAGGAVALGLLTNNYTALVGVAIASTFLPHATNCGLLWAWTCHLAWRGLNEKDVTVSVVNPADNETMVVETKPSFLPQDGYRPIFSYDMRWECMHLSYVSLLNTYVNVLCLYAGCLLILKLKEVAPLGSFEPHRKFFQEDMRIYRDYHTNKKLAAQRRSAISIATTGEDDDDDALGDDILREWADIAGLDANKLLSGDPKAKVTQIQTLKDLANEVQNDKDYRAVTSQTTGIPEPDLVRRLTHGQLHIPKEFLERHTGEPQGQQGIDNASFLDDVEQEMSGVHTVQARRRAGSRVRIQIPSERSGISTPTIVEEEYGLNPDQMEAHSQSTMPLRLTLRERRQSLFSVWPSRSQQGTPQLPSPHTSSSPRYSASRTSTSSRVYTRM